VAAADAGVGSSWYAARRLGVLAVYALAAVLSYILAARVVNGSFPKLGPELGRVLTLLLLIRLACSRAFGLSTSQWRFISLSDVLRLGSATACGSALFLLASRSWPALFPVRIAVFLLEGLMTGCAIAATWIVYRAVFERLRHRRAPGQEKTRRVLMVGAGEAGSVLVREMLRFPTGYRPVGFLDDDPQKHGARIHGVRVYGAVKDLARAAVDLRAEEVVIAIPSAAPTQLRALVSACERAGVSFKVLPGIVEVLAGDVRLNQVRDVQIEDLLGRDPIRLELPELATDLAGRSVLITGAAGSIGSELARQVALHGPATLVLFDQAETDLYYIELELRERHPELQLVPVIGDIVDAAAVERVFQEYAPQRVFHAAAYKHVPMMELNPREAIRNNVIGTWRVADAAGRHGAGKLVLVSTDKAVLPANIMGATKRLAERTILEVQRQFPETIFGAVRFGNVLGSNGSVIPIFRRQLEKGKALTVTHPETTRYFMTIPEAVQLILQASLLPELRGQIAMLDMGEPVRIADLALNLIRLSGVPGDPEERIVYTGLRPGEKLHEELVAPDERAYRTAIPKVRLLETPCDAAAGVIAAIGEWERDFAEGRDEAVEAALGGLFPEIAAVMLEGDESALQRARLASGA
jgi:FlaA1/EpsC-like NDP-sugar epimerase